MEAVRRRLMVCVCGDAHVDESLLAQRASRSGRCATIWDELRHGTAVLRWMLCLGCLDSLAMQCEAGMSFHSCLFTLCGAAGILDMPRPPEVLSTCVSILVGDRQSRGGLVSLGGPLFPTLGHVYSLDAGYLAGQCVCEVGWIGCGLVATG
jgi:hypothetical protein